MTAPPDVWCAIPVYNNAATIPDVAARSRQQLTNVIVIDDGSTDGDLRQLLKPLDFTVIRHARNLGKGAALLTAMQHASERGARYLITLDGDGQHFPEDIPRFFPHLRPDAIAVGCRREVTGLMPQSSRFGRDFSDFWIRVESGGIVRDSQSGFRAYPLPASLRLKVDSRRYGFEVEILTRAFWAGMRAETVPIRVWYPPAAQRISSFHPFRDNTRISLLHARLIARQLLPLPHREERIHHGGTEGAEKTNASHDQFAFPGALSSSLSLRAEGRASIANHTFPAALTAGICTFFSIVLWPWGFIAVAYLAIRLHLNKLIAFACVIFCMPTRIATLSTRIGHAMIHSDSHPRLERFAGSHIIAIPACLAAAALAYTVAMRLQPETEA